MPAVTLADGFKYGFRFLGVFLAVLLGWGAFIAGGWVLASEGIDLATYEVTAGSRLAAGSLMGLVGVLGLLGSTLGLGYKFVADGVNAGLATTRASGGATATETTTATAGTDGTQEQSSDATGKAGADSTAEAGADDSPDSESLFDDENGDPTRNIDQVVSEAVSPESGGRAASKRRGADSGQPRSAADGPGESFADDASPDSDWEPLDESEL